MPLMYDELTPASFSDNLTEKPKYYKTIYGN